MSAINLKQLAAHLGLTASTVSRALNNYRDISPDTRKRVQEAATKFNYRPSRIAQQLARGKLRTETVAYVMPPGVHRFSDPFFASFIAGVGDTLASTERDLLITTPSCAQSELDTYERLITENKANGFILTRIHPEDERVTLLEKHKIPFVCHGRTLNAERFNWYDVDTLRGSKLVANRFIEQGHRRLRLITPPQQLNFSRLLEQGFNDAIITSELAINLQVGEGNMSEESGFEITSSWIKSEQPNPDAIFCGSDAMAIGAMTAIKQHDLTVGRDIAIIGYGDFPLAAYVTPTLTTLKQPLNDAGKKVTQMLLQQLDNPDKEPEHVLLPLTLMERESDC